MVFKVNPREIPNCLLLVAKLALTTWSCKIHCACTMQPNKVLAFLDVCIDNNDPSCLKITTYRKKTFTGLLTNFLCFTSFSYQVGLIRTLVDRAYKMNNSLLSFDNDVKKLTHILKTNQFPECLINKVDITYLDNNGNSAQSDNNNTLYFKLPYLPSSNVAQRKVRTLINRVCK